jgi:hypothetical protein
MATIGTETAFEAAPGAGARGDRSERDPPRDRRARFRHAANVREAAKRALDDGWTHYGRRSGCPPARGDRADASARKGFTASPDRVVVTPGAKPIMFYAIRVAGRAGVEVIFPDPGFPIYESMTRFCGGTPVRLPIRQELDFRIDLDELERLITPRTRLLILNSPANPTAGSSRGPTSSGSRSWCWTTTWSCWRRDLRPHRVRRRHVSLASLPGWLIARSCSTDSRRPTR